MRTQEQKDGSDKFTGYVFIAGVVVCLASFVVWAVTGGPQPAVRIFTTAFWLVFAALSGKVFYTGRFRWKNGPTFTREVSPRLFYASAIFFTLGSMSIATFLLWAAYFTK